MALNAALSSAAQRPAIPATGGHTLMVALIGLAVATFITLLVAHSPDQTEATAASDIWRGNAATLTPAAPAPGVVAFK